MRAALDEVSRCICVQRKSKYPDMKASDLLIASFADLRAAEEYLSKANKDKDPKHKTTRNETTTQDTNDETSIQQS